jgi:hypothetical protein
VQAAGPCSVQAIVGAHETNGCGTIPWRPSPSAGYNRPRACSLRWPPPPGTSLPGCPIARRCCWPPERGLTQALTAKADRSSMSVLVHTRHSHGDSRRPGGAQRRCKKLQSTLQSWLSSRERKVRPSARRLNDVQRRPDACSAKLDPEAVFGGATFLFGSCWGRQMCQPGPVWRLDGRWSTMRLPTLGRS